MEEYEVRPACHEVKFVVLGGGEEDELYVLCLRVTHLGHREVFVSRDLVRLVECREHVDERRSASWQASRPARQSR